MVNKINQDYQDYLKDLKDSFVSITETEETEQNKIDWITPIALKTQFLLQKLLSNNSQTTSTRNSKSFKIKNEWL